MAYSTMMECFFASLEQELTHHARFETRDEDRDRLLEQIEVF